MHASTQFSTEISVKIDLRFTLRAFDNQYTLKFEQALVVHSYITDLRIFTDILLSQHGH